MNTSIPQTTFERQYLFKDKLLVALCVRWARPNP
jgi:hypothetical protein